MDYNRKRNDLLIELQKYYTPGKFAIILPVLMGEDVLTMSIINYVVITYSKKYDSCIIEKNKTKTVYTYINRSYDAKLDQDRRQCFDAFCREPKIYFEYEPGKSILTSVAQLNFYKWVLDIGLLDFIRENYDHIKYDYDLRSKSESIANSTSQSMKQHNKFKTSSSISSAIFDED